MEEAVLSWENFVERYLLNSGLISGVVMMSPRGTVSYRHGNLSTLKQEDFIPIVDLFSSAKSSEDKKELNSGIKLRLSEHLTDFKIYKKTFCSVYCVSSEDSSGLVISRLPYGILVCSYHHPATSTQATSLIHNFCDRLRA